MTQYIDKSALVAEIKRRMDENRGKQTLPQYFGMIEEDLSILSFIDTLEVKEVDLDKELNKYFITNNLIAADIQFEPVTQMKKCAQYFFELGMQVSNKAQKGE